MRKKTKAPGWRALASKNCAMTGLASAARGLAGAFIGRDAIACRSSFEAQGKLGGAGKPRDGAADGQTHQTEARPATPVARRKAAHPDHLRTVRRRNAQSAHGTRLQD